MRSEPLEGLNYRAWTLIEILLDLCSLWKSTLRKDFKTTLAIFCLPPAPSPSLIARVSLLRSCLQGPARGMRISHRTWHCCLYARALVPWVDGSAQDLFCPQNKLPNVNCSRWHNCMALFLPIYWKKTKLSTSVKRAWLGHFSIWGRRGRRAAFSPCSCSCSSAKRRL